MLPTGALDARMRIALHDFGGYPFSAQLARTLATRGHEVVYLYAGGFKRPRAAVSSEIKDPPGLTYRAVDAGSTYRGNAGVRRLLQERHYGSLLARAVLEVRPDVVMSANCPLDAQAMAQHAAHRSDAAFVFWLQDIYSLAVDRLLRRRLSVAGRLVGWRFARLERKLLRESDAVVAISPDFLPILEEWRVPSERVKVIENWAPLDALPPLTKVNDWSKRHGLSDIPVFLYAGTLGRKHDPTLLIDLARAVPEARVVVVCEGVGAIRLRDAPASPANLMVLPLQPAEELPAVLASGDILVAILEHDAGEFSIPSKVLTYLAAGRPILAAIPPANLAARTIEAAGAGLVVDPADRQAFIGAANSLLANPGARSRAGLAAREFASRAFDPEAKADAFEAVLGDAVLGCCAL